MDFTFIYDEEIGKAEKIRVDAFGFPVTEERKQDLWNAHGYSKWVWDDVDLKWVAPVPMPEPILSAEGWVDYFHVWNDDAGTWDPIRTQPFHSWVRDEHGFWVAPVPYPNVTISDDGVPSAVYKWDEETRSWVESS